jgi:hypothetical protein
MHREIIPALRTGAFQSNARLPWLHIAVAHALEANGETPLASWLTAGSLLCHPKQMQTPAAAPSAVGMKKTHSGASLIQGWKLFTR